MSTTSVPVAVAFDVDGVLLRGKEPIPGAADALRKLQQNKIPYVFVTNGGGCLESEKAAQISSILGVALQPEQVVLAHSPFRDLAIRLAHQEVLVVGKRRIHHIAHEYGFRNTFDTLDLHHSWPALFADWPAPLKHAEVDPHPHPHPHMALPIPAFTPTQTLLQPSTMQQQASPFSTVSAPALAPQLGADYRTPSRLAAALVFMDPLHYHRDAQLLVDVLRSSGIPGDDCGGQKVELHVAGPDMEYVTEWPVPRFGAGIFPDMVARLFKVATGRELEVTMYGKPHAATYTYAKRVLERVSGGNVERVVMVGDNPLSDIAGARINGWDSALVRTGMYRGDVLDESVKPTRIVDDVQAAVDWVIHGK